MSPSHRRRPCYPPSPPFPRSTRRQWQSNSRVPSDVDMRGGGGVKSLCSEGFEPASSKNRGCLAGRRSPTAADCDSNRRRDRRGARALPPHSHALSDLTPPRPPPCSRDKYLLLDQKLQITTEMETTERLEEQKREHYSAELPVLTDQDKALLRGLDAKKEQQRLSDGVPRGTPGCGTGRGARGARRAGPGRDVSASVALLCVRHGTERRGRVGACGSQSPGAPCGCVLRPRSCVWALVMPADIGGAFAGLCRGCPGSLGEPALYEGLLSPPARGGGLQAQ